MLHAVKRTTVNLSDEIDARLRYEASRRGVTISDIAHEAIEAHLGKQSGRSGRQDITRRIEEIIRRETRYGVR